MPTQNFFKDESRKKNQQLHEKLGDIKIKEKERVVQTQAVILGINYINLVGFAISDEALRILPKDKAETLKTICFLLENKELRLATVDSTNVAVQDLAQELSRQGYHVEIYLTSQHSFDKALQLYERLPKIKEVTVGVKISQNDFELYKNKIKKLSDVQAEIQDADISKIVTVIIAAAVQAEASDIHVEAEEKDIKLRYRIDGVLQDVAILDKELWKNLNSRIKLLAKLKINIIDQPQDGRFSIFLHDQKIDVRVSCLPTNFGESVVMRLLTGTATSVEFESLGLIGQAFEQLSQEIKRPNGMILTTGPTGSGKTTTLYAILKKIKNSQTKIITLENPIEYQLDGISQSNVDIDKGYGFADGLKSILRQDPDVIMVGEIRDYDTVDTAINAALTGHLVLSTLHTNSAAATIPRFLSMGAKPFLLAPSLNVIIAQRLVRRVCEKCKQEIQLSEADLEKIKKILQSIPEAMRQGIDLENLKFYHGQGCESCQGIGYKGRIGIYEVLTMNEEIEKMVLNEKVSEYDILNIAQQNGMVTMVQDGLLKALQGVTSVEEVFRVAE
ncbi:MAG: GspE/PulE family protein [Patescibacteria group bacterium]|nr:GspE/PulE family protein [Patescibacteria group bacterium]